MTPKTIKKLADKKYRIETGLFLVEGEKSIQELLDSDFIVEAIYGTKNFISSLKTEYSSVAATVVSDDALVKMGTLQTNNAGIAVARQKEVVGESAVLTEAKNNFILALSEVRDPGNLGTIIRIADWFGVRRIVASEGTTDFYNPKTIGASMGSFTRVSVSYTALPAFLTDAEGAGLPIMGAVLDGKSVHEGGLPKNGVLLMGSESHGIDSALLQYTSHKVTIPKFGSAESLNVSIATGILLDALRRP
jgi:TrmH family RNA methyltransferase